MASRASTASPCVRNRARRTRTLPSHTHQQPVGVPTPPHPPRAADIYALYFAIMTITSVGFGDVTASAFNTGEQICCAAIMFLTALLWGYLVGVFCTLAAAAPNVQAFRDELSQLNSFMSDHNLPSELRFRLRECECPRVETVASRPQPRLMTC